MKQMGKKSAWIIEELRAAEKAGAAFYLNEFSYSIKDEEEILLALEDTCYMVWDGEL